MWSKDHNNQTLRCISCLFIVFLLLIAGIIVPISAANAALPASNAVVLPYPEPEITAKSALVMDRRTGKILWAYKPNKKLAMASTAKMMTAILALQYADPNEIIKVYPRDLVGGSTAYLRAGEKLTLTDLLKAALIPSGNDAAVTIADYVGRKYLGGVGDNGIQVFVDEMNAKAHELGLDHTVFRTPNGFDAPGQYSTALDLAKLGRELLDKPLLSSIVGTYRTRVIGHLGGKPVYHTLVSTNDLLPTYPGMQGIKTGTTPAAGENLVSYVKRGNIELIAVVLGSQDRFADTRAILDWMFSSYSLAESILPITSPTTAHVNYLQMYPYYLEARGE